MNINIISIGKNKEKFIELGIKEYKNRISKYAKINEIIINDEYLPSKPSEIEIKKALAKEAEKINKVISNKDYNICLDINSELLSSEGFATKMKNIFITYPRITFLIGSSYGLDESVKSMCNYKMSFGKMTYPHMLMKVILLEQIYRGATIINNINYHK